MVPGGAPQAGGGDSLMADPRLTKAQSEALRVLAMEGRARISNVTRPRGDREPCIYWHSWVALI